MIIRQAKIEDVPLIVEMLANDELGKLREDFQEPLPEKYYSAFENIDNDTFDFVYSSHSLEHTPNPISALNDQIRITKPGGIIYSVIPNKKNTYDRLRKTTS